MIISGAAPGLRSRGRFALRTRARQLCRTALGIMLLWGVAQFAHAVVAAGRLPLPGNVVAFVLLFALLQLRVVRASWFEDGATFLISHMSLFFVPLAVGALAYGSFLARSGIGAIATLVVSATLGLVAAGRSAAAVQSRRRA